MLDLDDMRLLVALRSEGSISGAARTRGMSKQRASERLSRLEAALGARLFQRTTRVLRATEQGERFIQRCQHLLEEADEALLELHAQQAEPSGLLRVAATLAFGHAFVVDLVADYLERYQAARVELLLADRRFDLIGESIDIAFQVAEALDAEPGVVRRLGPVVADYVAAPSYLARYGEPYTAEEWSRARVIGRFPGETWPTADGQRVRLSPTLLVSTPHAAMQAALRGVGIAWLPAILITEALEKGLLARLSGKPARETAIYAVFPTRRHLPAKVRALVDLAVERLPFAVPPVG